jgi:membrane fusion protein (multidrug efflux system)
MYANVAVEVGEVQRYLTLPQTAVAFNPYGSTVFVAAPAKDAKAGAKPPLTVHQVFVTTGATRGDQIAILKGINDGDTVVTSGQLKLKNDAQIVIDNRLAPTNDVNPQPVEAGAP